MRCLDCNGVDMAILPDGAVALNYFLAATDAGQPADTNEGFAVHIIEADGEPRLSLDGIPMKDRFDPVEDADRHLQVAPDGSLLVAHRRRYRIDRWDPATGELLRTFVREADWVRDRATASPGPARAASWATAYGADARSRWPRRKSRRRSCCRLPLAGRGISPCPAPRRPRCDAGIIRPARTAAGSGCSPRCCRSSRTGS